MKRKLQNLLLNKLRKMVRMSKFMIKIAYPDCKRVQMAFVTILKIKIGFGILITWPVHLMRLQLKLRYFETILFLQYFKLMSI